MGNNIFGQLFTIMTWGESHGKAVGVVIDGCPAGIEITEEEINAALAWRAPGRRAHTSPRREPDCAEILSGVFEGKTTGTPISIMIPNRDADSSKYEPIKHLLRAGHANYTYTEKYGVFDYRGGGRASARETACRVAAGAVACKLLSAAGINLTAYLQQVGEIRATIPDNEIQKLQQAIEKSPIFCPDSIATEDMCHLLETTRQSGDSLGGVVEFIVNPIPVGLGDPVYGKLEAKLSHAMMSLPASKGFEMGAGFQATIMQGSQHNDLFILHEGNVRTATNHSGGTLAGISNGMPIIGRVAFKPTSSIMKPQETLNMSGEQAKITLPEGSKHDPCVAIRAVPVVKAMAALVIADAFLLNRCARL